ncbi:MAG: CBS domain-containing protein [Pseudomonadota bacterium]
MKSIGDVLDKKGRYVWSVKPDDTIFDSLQMMADKGIGGVVVMDGDQLVGIVTERDYARRVILEGKASKSATIGEIMTKNVRWVSEEQTIDECMALMIERQLRHLPVMQDDKVIGVVSIRDLVQAVVAEQKVIIDHLQHYITGPDWA